jgi:hypothetical protein
MKRSYREFLRFKKDIADMLASESTDMSNLIYQEMLFNIAQLREENPDLVELRLLNTAFKELRHALRVFNQYRSVPKAAVFGSARTPQSDPNYKLAEIFGQKLAKKGWMLITGGASGIMEAAMVGAGAEKSFGLNIMLPFEQDANPIIKGNPKLMFFKYFFTRKLMFLKESQATVLFPGGFGTFDEGFESLTLVQTGKAKPRPLVFVDTPGSSFWSSTLKLFKKNMEDSRYISKGDMGLVRHFQDPDQAIDEIIGFYSNYHSSRFFKDRYLIRLKKPIFPETLSKLGAEFKDIITKGGFEHFLNANDDDIKDPTLERITFYFDKASYNRLRELINRLNSL